jgi:hypothetical protein
MDSSLHFYEDDPNYTKHLCDAIPEIGNPNFECIDLNKQDGVVIGQDGSMWLRKKVPSSMDMPDYVGTRVNFCPFCGTPAKAPRA